jgi:hypothetical protein
VEEGDLVSPEGEKFRELVHFKDYLVEVVDLMNEENPHRFRLDFFGKCVWIARIEHLIRPKR